MRAYQFAIRTYSIRTYPIRMHSIRAYQIETNGKASRNKKNKAPPSAATQWVSCFLIPTCFSICLVLIRAYWIRAYWIRAYWYMRIAYWYARIAYWYARIETAKYKKWRFLEKCNWFCLLLPLLLHYRAPGKKLKSRCRSPVQIPETKKKEPWTVHQGQGKICITTTTLFLKIFHLDPFIILCGHLISIYLI